MNTVLPEKSEIGIWYKKVEFELDRFIFVAPKPLPEEEWTKLCKQYGQHQTRVLAGDALLIDLRGNEPTFGSVPRDLFFFFFLKNGRWQLASIDCGKLKRRAAEFTHCPSPAA